MDPLAGLEVLLVKLDGVDLSGKSEHRFLQRRQVICGALETTLTPEIDFV
jgi:hypothetical protein